MDLALDFAAKALGLWGVLLAIYFAFGTAMERLTARTPGRKIQPRRDGLARKRADIRVAVPKLALSAALVAAGWTARDAGWTPAPAATAWWSVALWFALGMVLFDAWFYAAHRLLHTRALYRFHALHHVNAAPTVWSNDCTGTVDTAMEHGFYLAIWFLPAPAAAILAVRLANQVIGMIGHSGHEFFAGRLARAPWPFVGSTYHDMHHATWRYNYANLFSVWDRLFGTAHPDYDRRIAARDGGAERR